MPGVPLPRSLCSRSRPARGPHSSSLTGGISTGAVSTASVCVFAGLGFPPKFPHLLHLTLPDQVLPILILWSTAASRAAFAWGEHGQNPGLKTPSANFFCSHLKAAQGLLIEAQRGFHHCRMGKSKYWGSAMGALNQKTLR